MSKSERKNGDVKAANQSIQMGEQGIDREFTPQQNLAPPHTWYTKSERIKIVFCSLFKGEQMRWKLYGLHKLPCVESG